MVFAHGFGCDQNMWRFVAPRFEDDFRVVLFDHVGAGGSDPTAYDAERYTSLAGYADDVLDICRELDLRDVIFVGHSVSAMIGALAAAKEPERFAKLVLVGPSPRYINDGDVRRRLHRGGHRRAARLAREQLPRLVQRDGAGDHGQPRPPGARRGADGELLPEPTRRSPASSPASRSSPTTAPTSRGCRRPRWSCSARSDVIAPVAVGEYVATSDCRAARSCSWTRPGTARTSARRTRRRDAIAAFVRA